MKIISNTLNTSTLNEGYFLTIETFNREKFYLQLNDEELRVISKFALSAMYRKKVLKHFITCISDQPKGTYSHIENWIKDIVKNSTSEFFTIQIDRLDSDEINTPVPYLKKFFFEVVE